MKWIIFCIFMIALALAEGDVFILTDANFDETIKNNPNIMVKFFAPWCGHCKAMAPEYEKAAKQLKEAKIPCLLAELDATVHKETATKFDIHSYPTVKFFVNGVPSDYSGKRTAGAIVSFIKNSTGSLIMELATIEEIKAQKEGKGLRCILATAGGAATEEYLAVAASNEEYQFFRAKHELVKQVFPEVNDGNLIILKDTGDKIAIYRDEVTEEKLKAFLLAESMEIVNRLDQKIIEQIFKDNGKTGIVLIHSEKDPNSKALEETFTNVAKEQSPKGYIFVRLPKEDTEAPRFTEYLGIGEESLPLIVIVLIKEGTLKYIHPGKMTESDIKTTITDFEKGTLKPFYKSEPVPTQNPGPVYKVVGKTFKHEVLDNTDDVMVKFYAPWCGHCKTLAPIYESVAEKLQGNKQLKFVEVDSTKNDVEGHPITGFPVVKFFPGKNKSRVQIYRGERDEASIINFLKEKASYPIEVSAPKPKEGNDGALLNDDL